LIGFVDIALKPHFKDFAWTTCDIYGEYISEQGCKANFKATN